jgi:exopolyphosphatase/guanosine-5'-triphosphate,3'-diphosphate pyrophosphatase
MPHSYREFPKKTIAAIDIGTNSAHLVIAEMDHVGEMRVLDSDKVTLRLGLAIGADGNLTEEGITRTVEALRHMREIISPHQKSNGATVRAVATYATREARNHKRLIDTIAKETGVHVELIDGIEEARLSFLGMRYGLALSGQSCLGVDIGGGSTEIIIAKDDDIDYVSSFKLGAVMLTDKYFVKKGLSADAFLGLKEHINSRLAPLPQETRAYQFQRALASSGTAKALAHMHARMFADTEVSDPNGYVLPREDLFEMVDEIGKLLTPQKIKEKTGLDMARAEIILAGATILAELTRLLKVKEWMITSYGLREGLVADTFYRAYGRQSVELPDIQWHSVLQFAKRLQVNETHAAHVTRLALRLLEQLQPLVRGSDDEETIDGNVKLLKATAYLREAGKFISAPQYHRHSQYLLTHCRLPGFTEAERSLMGLIARFQRKAVPAADHRDCAELSGAEIKRLRFLSGILRLASALDRTRQSRVTDVSVDVDDDGAIEAATVTLFHDGDGVPDVELHKAKLERSSLEKSFDLKLKFNARAAPRPKGQQR